MKNQEKNGDDTTRLPDVEGVHGIEGQLDDVKYIQLLNTISLANLVAGTIPDNADLVTEKYLNKLIRSHRKSAHISNVPKLASQSVEYMPRTSLEIKQILTPEAVIKKTFRENLRVHFLVILAAMKFRGKLGGQLKLQAHANWLPESIMVPAKLANVHLLIDPSKQDGCRDITPRDVSEPLFGWR